MIYIKLDARFVSPPPFIDTFALSQGWSGL